MTLAIIGFILGAIFGIWRARRAKGDAADAAQYAIVFGMIFALAGVILTVIVVRSF